MARRRTEPPRNRAKHGKRSLTTEQRQELSERARKMHQNGQLDAKRNGALGGKAKGAKTTITSEISTAAMRDRKAIVAALKAGIREGSPAQRTKAAETFVRLADLETQRQQKAVESEQRVKAEMTRDERIAALAASLTTGPLADALKARMATDSTAVEIEEADVISASSSA